MRTPIVGITPLRIEILPSDDDAPVNVSAIVECARFLNSWLSNGAMRVDAVQMGKIASHAHRARANALQLIKV